MTILQLYQWMSDNMPIPYEIRMLYAQLGRTISKDQAWWIVWLHGVKCTGPYGVGFNLFAKELGKESLLPAHKNA